MSQRRKTITTGTSQQDIQELRCQIINIANDQNVLYDAQNDLAEMVSNLEEEVKKRMDEILLAVSDLKESLAPMLLSRALSNTSHSSLQNLNTLFSEASATSAASLFARRQTYTKNVIPAPRKTAISKGKRALIRDKIMKEHVIDKVIKSGQNRDLSDAQCEAIYNTMVGERKVALDALVKRLLQKMAVEAEGASIDLSQAKIYWGAIDDSEKSIAIHSFSKSVSERCFYNLYLCEDNWAAVHILCEGWNNRKGMLVPRNMLDNLIMESEIQPNSSAPEAQLSSLAPDVDSTSVEQSETNSSASKDTYQTLLGSLPDIPQNTIARALLQSILENETTSTDPSTRNRTSILDYESCHNSLEDHMRYWKGGKSLLFKTLLSCVRSQDHIALPVASSSIAAILLPGGRTAHTCFKIPIDADKTAICNLPLGGTHAYLIRQASLIIWDEAVMCGKWNFQAVDKALCDIMGATDSALANVPFSGKVAAFGSDFQQLLPVIKKETRSKIVANCISATTFWRHLIDITDTTALIDAIYPTIREPNPQPEHFSNHTILASTNADIDEINNYAFELFPGDTRQYLSTDHIIDADDPDVAAASSIPPHALNLKVGMPLILLRNLNPDAGLCNGTKVFVTALLDHSIVVKRIGIGHNGEEHYIPRINICTTEEEYPFILSCRQFPVRPAFSMTIHKSQGQLLTHIGIHLQEPVFIHSQLYVALSRATDPNCY
ncbi:hypothetical protein INT45_012858 [Circinella minor]|uniref:ATP-dependent DNA helicase n=1 Tax=Circinella minor TaxID=1195481 RepID=A0A8H7S7L7_9FUNG|nr:hypothetical protein INT45_012858 [Circinella minor]